MEHTLETCPVQKQLLKLEQDYNELQSNLQLSAVYGKSLLEEINALKLQIKEMQSLQEVANQENHHLRMQLEVAQKSHVSQTQELEAMKETLQKTEEINRQLKALDEEQLRKESSLVTQMANFKDQEEAHKEQYEQKIKELEMEIKNLKSAEREPVVMSCNHEEEIMQIHMELESTQENKKRLEDELMCKERQIQQFEGVEKLHKHKVEELELEIRAKEKELASSDKVLEEKRTEILELQALLEAERVSQTNPEKRGNSIFSEVEDRRQQVERHLTKLTTLLDKEKRKNQDLQAEIVKVKNQVAFLACSGNNSDSSRSVEQLENLLRSTTIQNKDLLKKIEELEKKTNTPSYPVPQLEDSRKWMQAMLAQKNEENDKLRAEIRDHIRSSLCQNDQLMQLSKQYNESEKNLQRARSEVFRLKLKNEEMAANIENNVPSNASPMYTVPPVRVVENLKFVVEKKEVASQPEKPLKERVVLQSQADQNTVVQHSTPSNNSSSGNGDKSAGNGGQSNNSIISPANETRMEEEKERSAMMLDSPIITPCEEEEAVVQPSQSALRRQVRMNNQVHVVYEDGDSTLETLAEDKFTAGAKKTADKPVGQQVEVVDVSKATPVMECNQQ